jgi:catechol 2,3-dioxygenase-like lactoylglutathione lyase family enzyme
MSDYFRLRQICLVAADLPRAIADMQAIFGVKLAYQDGNVRRYGLENALFPFGLAFIEIVSPVEANTAAGRFLERSRGVGGYMAIFNCNDPERRGRHANALGVRTAHAIAHDGFTAVQLHPRDCGAAMIEFDRSEGEEDLRGFYHPAGGTRWIDAVKTDVTRRLREIVVESPDPVALGQHWSRIIERPFAADRDGGFIAVDMTGIRFARSGDERAVLRTLVIEMADCGGIERRARDRGYDVTAAGVEFSGVRFQLATR